MTPLINLGLSDAQLAEVGRFVVTSAHVEYWIDEVLENLERRFGVGVSHLIDGGTMFTKSLEDMERVRSLREKQRAIKELMGTGIAPEAVDLHRELRWAMKRVTPVRNMLAHGILLFDDAGVPSWWSQLRFKEVTLEQIAAATVYLNYASHAAGHFVWMLKGITPPQVMPPRPGA